MSEIWSRRKGSWETQNEKVKIEKAGILIKKIQTQARER
jgi:hypothetical protein